MAGSFTAHNIRLDDGSFTKPEQPYQMEDLALLKFTKQFLRILFPEGAAGKRVVDLGCLEGGYAVELARAGFDALGIEVRQSNFENCQRVKAGTNLPKLTFLCDDVSKLAKYGVFDVVFCCGLLYHLEEPHRFVDWRRCAGEPPLSIPTLPIPSPTVSLFCPKLPRMKVGLDAGILSSRTTISAIRTSGRPGAIGNHSGR